MAKIDLTAARLRELLSYDPDTGVFTRKTKAGGQPIGATTGYKASDGRVMISIDNYNYRAHRLVWLYVHGYMSTMDIDHIDGDPSNNKLANLREVSHQVNLQNRRHPTKANGFKLMGVTKNRDGFGAQIKVNGERVWLGTYGTPELAHSVYMHARRKLLEGNTL